MGKNNGLDFNHIIETALGVAIVGGAALALFWIGQHHFSLFSYQGMNRNQVLQVYEAVEQRLPILSRACGRSKLDPNVEFCRGIYLTTQGNVLYYRLEDNITKNKASFSLYSIPSERWTTEPEAIEGMGGKVIEVDPQRLLPTSLD